MPKNKYQRASKEIKRKARNEYFKTEFGNSLKKRLNRLLIYSVLLLGFQDIEGMYPGIERGDFLSLFVRWGTDGILSHGIGKKDTRHEPIRIMNCTRKRGGHII